MNKNIFPNNNSFSIMLSTLSNHLYLQITHLYIKQTPSVVVKGMSPIEQPISFLSLSILHIDSCCFMNNLFLREIGISSLALVHSSGVIETAEL